MGVVARKVIDRVVRPQSWFRTDVDAPPDKAPGNGAALGKTDALIYEPKNKEAEAILKAKPCANCRFFKYRDGQERIQRDRVTQAMMYDLKWTSVVENTDPADFGNCDADGGKITHKFATCDCFAPANENASNVWRRVQAAVKAFKNGGGT